MIEAVHSAAVEKFPEAEVTGYYVLLTRLIESVLADQWKDFDTVPDGLPSTAALFAAVPRGANAGRGSNRCRYG